MKAPKKGLATGLLAMAMVTCPVSAWGGGVLPVYASETPVSAGVTATENYSEEGKQDCEITVTIGSDFTITIPKKIILSGMDGTSNYEVTAKGNISADERIKVVPDKNFFLKSTGKADVTTAVSQNKTSFGYASVSKTDDLGALVGITVQGTVTAEELSAGNWAGEFNFNISLENATGAGAYDANGEMVASWEELTGTYGLDVEKVYGVETKEEDYWKTSPTSGYYVLTNNEALKDVTSIVIGNDVTSLGTCAFQECTNLTSVIIPDGVTTLGRGVFWGCDSLTSVTIPDSVTDMGTYTFGMCNNLTSITIPDSVTSIGRGVFGQCGSLTSIDIPDGVTSIGEYAFLRCPSLTSVTIPNSVTSIGKSAFSGCTSLIVTIPDSVTSIGEYAFDDVHHIYYNGTATGSPWGALAIN